jgi:tetratricopeptide (TPR) repeat protein
MTEQGPSLPGDILASIALKKKEALEAELHSLEEQIASGMESRLADRRTHLEDQASAARKESEEAGMKELSDLQSFGEESLKRLEAERVRRRSERQRDEERRRDERLLKEKQEEEEKKRQAEEEEKKKKTAAEDPSVKVRVFIRNAQGHMQRGDMELAVKSIAEGLEIDGFNAELLELDAKVREAMASDTFSTAAQPAPESKKEKGKGKQQKQKQPKVKPPKQEAPVAAPGKRKFPSWAFTAIAAVLVLGAALIAFLEYAPKPAANGMTLAVLPWTFQAGAGDVGVYTDELPGIIVKNLAESPSGVSVLGYTTTSNLSAIGSDPVASLIRLGYSHFLRGTLSGRDSQYTIHVELSDSSGSTLWSEEYQRDGAGLLLVPREIAHGLRTYFREAPTAGEGTALQVQNPAAYLLYLDGLNALRKPDNLGLDGAINAFNRSLALDSTLAGTYAALSEALAGKYVSSRPGPVDLLQDAESAAARAIGLAPRSGDGYIAMGRALIEGHRYPDALGMLDSAARFSPGESMIPYLRGLAFFRSGQPVQALELLQRAYRLDPRNVAILDLIGTIQQMNKSFERALWYRETEMFFAADSLRFIAGPLSDVIMLDPTLRLKQEQRVTSACLRLLEHDPYDYQTLYSLGRMLQVSGDIEESLTYLNGLELSLRARIRSNPTDTRAKMYLALTLTRLGRYAEGIATGTAAAAADTNDIEARYLLARVYALQTYSPETKTVDEAKLARSVEILKEAMGRRFIDSQLCSADLYNVYFQSNIWDAFEGRGAGKK